MKKLCNLLILLLLLFAPLHLLAQMPAQGTYAFVHSYYNGNEAIQVYHVSYSQKQISNYLQASWANSQQMKYSPTALVWPEGDANPFLAVISWDDQEIRKITRDGKVEQLHLKAHNFVSLAEGPEGSLYAIGRENEIYRIHFDANGVYTMRHIYHVSIHSSGPTVQLQSIDENSFLLLTENHLRLVHNDGSGFKSTADYYISGVSIKSRGSVYEEPQLRQMLGTSNYVWVYARFKGPGSFIPGVFLVDLNQKKIQEHYFFNEGEEVQLLDMDPASLKLSYRRDSSLYTLTPAPVQEFLEHKDILSVEYLRQLDSSIPMHGKLDLDFPKRVSGDTKRVRDLSISSSPQDACPSGKCFDPSTAFEFKTLFNKELHGLMPAQMTLKDFTDLINRHPALSLYVYLLDNHRLAMVGLSRRYQWLSALPGREEEVLETAEARQGLISELCNMLEEGKKAQQREKCAANLTRP